MNINKSKITRELNVERRTVLKYIFLDFCF